MGIQASLGQSMSPLKQYPNELNVVHMCEYIKAVGSMLKVHIDNPCMVFQDKFVFVSIFRDMRDQEIQARHTKMGNSRELCTCEFSLASLIR